MLENMNSMLLKAKKEKYAVPHFNINNLEWARFILEECEELHSPVILGVSEGAAKYMGGFCTVVYLVKGLLVDLNITVPVAIHLDHGSSVESCKAAIDAGFTSVMIDASKYSLEENIFMTSAVVQYAHEYDVSVEAEIGHIGGVEDGVKASIMYADVNDCLKLVQGTGLDVLAPALGSSHGIYKGEPHLDFDRAVEISKLCDVPLVMHGGSGIGNEQIQKAISCGITKLNINTDLQLVWTRAVRDFLNENLDVYDPRKVIQSGEKAMKEMICKKVCLLGSKDRV